MKTVQISDRHSSKTEITTREKQVLKLISYGFSTTEIADSLNVTNETVKTHRKHLLRKLGANNVAALVRVGMEYGLI